MSVPMNFDLSKPSRHPRVLVPPALEAERPTFLKAWRDQGHALLSPDALDAETIKVYPRFDAVLVTSAVAGNSEARTFIAADLDIVSVSKLGDFLARPVTRPWQQTSSGRVAYLDVPTHIDFAWGDVAVALSRITRYCGHAPITVAEHCLRLVAYGAATGKSVRWMLTALLHDASEAYYGDVTSPTRKIIRGYQTPERECTLEVFRRHGLTEDDLNSFLEFDLAALMSERRMFHKTATMPWSVEVPGLGDAFECAPMPSSQAALASRWCAVRRVLSVETDSSRAASAMMSILSRAEWT